MCDYSLMGIPNRLAKQGEALVLYTFPTGTKGFTSSGQVTVTWPKRPTRGFGLWRKLNEMLQPPKPEVATAVCIPPGARLTIPAVPAELRSQLGVGATELVTFTQLSSDSNLHRDAVRFCNGTEISLQCFPAGMRIRVNNLDLDAPATPARIVDGLAVLLG